MSSLEDIRIYSPETGSLLWRIPDCHSKKLDGERIHLIGVGVCQFTDPRMSAITGNEKTTGVGSTVFKVRRNGLFCRSHVHDGFGPLLPLVLRETPHGPQPGDKP